MSTVDPDEEIPPSNLLSVEYISQEEIYYCQFTCVQMALNYLNITPLPTQLRIYQELLELGERGSSVPYSVNISFDKRGIPVHVELDLSPDDIRKYNSEGYLIIVPSISWDIGSLSGHSVLVIGYDETGIFIHDPWPLEWGQPSWRSTGPNAYLSDSQLVSDFVTGGRIEGVRIGTERVEIRDPPENSYVGSVCNVTIGARVYNLTVSGYYDYVESVELYIDGSPVEKWVESGVLTYYWDTTGYSDGLHTIELVVHDKAGYSRSDTVNVMVDNVVPTAEIRAPADGSCLKGVCDVVVYAYDANFARSELYFGGSAAEIWHVSGAQALEWNTTAIEDGSYDLKLKVYDKARNMVETSVAVVVDNNPPIVGISSPVQGAVIKGHATTVTWEVDDIASGVIKVEASLDGGSWMDVTGDTSHTFTGLTEGSHIVKVRATDHAENVAEDSTEFTVTIPLEPRFELTNLSISPTEVKPREDVMITVTVMNLGELEGTYTVTLNIDGSVEATKNVTVPEGGSTIAAFETAKDVAGTYGVEVAGLKGEFIVKEITPSPIELWLPYIVVAIIVVAISAITAILIKRRK